MAFGKCPLLLECVRALSDIEKNEAGKQRASKINSVCAVCFVPGFYGYAK